jgi:hypothetical protein
VKVTAKSVLVPAEFDARKTTGNSPKVLGLPETVPQVSSREIPGGRLPTTEKMYGPTDPVLTSISREKLMDEFGVSLLSPAASESRAGAALATVNSKSVVAVTADPKFATIVLTVVATKDVGVPLMVPVIGSIDKPAGRLALKVAVVPAEIAMVTGVMTTLSSPFTTATEGVTVGSETVKVKVSSWLLPPRLAALTVST